MRILLLLPIVIFICGCQTQPPNPRDSINPVLCDAPQYLDSYQRNLCARQKAGTAPAYQPVTILTPDPEYKLTAKDISIVKNGVAKELKDPTSPIFGNMKATKSKKDVITVCGFVNGKNSYGAYTGQKPFIGALTNNNFLLIGIGEDDIHTTATYDVCAQKGIHLP